MARPSPAEPPVTTATCPARDRPGAAAGPAGWSWPGSLGIPGMIAEPGRRGTGDALSAAGSGGCSPGGQEAGGPTRGNVRISIPASRAVTRAAEENAHTPAVMGAPRGALLYSPRSGQRLEEVSLDLMADP